MLIRWPNVALDVGKEIIDQIGKKASFSEIMNHLHSE
jgi:hypothetical protein